MPRQSRPGAASAAAVDVCQACQAQRIAPVLAGVPGRRTLDATNIANRDNFRELPASAGPAPGVDGFELSPD
ncbi:MAG TPA: hypothetical protein VFQ53_12745 [Kofleriaceae bacterium]|nr:hypothetical protein [Kofleriaceae bacterium]